MSIFDKIRDIVFVSDDEDYEDEMVEETERVSRESITEEPIYTPKREAPARLIKSKASNYSSATSGMELILEKPTRFEDVKGIVNKLNEGKAVVLNLEDTPIDIQRRIVDFLSGAAYAIGGNMRKVSKFIFVVASRGVDVKGDILSDDFDEEKIYF